MKRNLPQMYLDFLHLPHNPESRSSVDFPASEYRRLGRELTKLSGIELNAEPLRGAIALYNRNRGLIRQLSQMRTEAPHLLRTSELYLLVRAGNFLPVEEHTRILEMAVERFPWRPSKPRDSVRVVVEGSFCERPPLALIRLLEEAGCYVVEDDFGLGQRWFEDRKSVV